jgi:hypothetical protein
MAGKQPHEPEEKPFPPFPPSHPILPPGAPRDDPGRDVKRNRDRDREGVHPHHRDEPIVEDEP